MTTMYKTIAAERTAEGATLDFYTLFDMFSNDWSLLGGLQDLRLDETTIVSSVSSFATMHEIWMEIPAYSVDARFDELEFVVVLRVEAKVSANPDCELRLTNSAASIVSNTVVVTDLSYATQAYLTLVYTTAAIPTGRTKMLLQGRWPSDPGSETLFVKRALDVSDCEFYVRVKP